MSDRFRTLTVVLENDADDLEAKAIARVITQIKGVAVVNLGDPVNGSDHAARMVARIELRAHIYKAIEEVFKGFLP